MKRTFFFLLAATVLAACNINVPVELAAFTHTIDSANPLKVTFENTSTSTLSPYMWEFGDGNVAFNEVNPTHIYKNAGTYEVTLTCKNKVGNLCTYTKPITVTAPGDNPGTDPVDDPGKTSKVYLKGFKLYNINSQNEKFYVQLEVQGIDLWGNTNPDLLTSPQMGYTYLLPLTFNIDKPVLIGETPNPFDFYKSMMFTLYCSNSITSQSGDIALIKYITDLSVMDNQTEYILTSGDTKVGLLFNYVQ